MASNVENIIIGVFEKVGDNSLNNLYEILYSDDPILYEDDTGQLQSYPNNHEFIKMDILRKNPPKYWVGNPAQAKFVNRKTMQLKLKEKVRLHFGGYKVWATEIINGIGLADVDGGFCAWWGRTGGMPFRIIKDRDNKFKLLWDYDTIIEKRKDIEGFMWEESDPPPDTATIPMELIYSVDRYPIGVKYLDNINAEPDFQYFYAFGERFDHSAVIDHLEQCHNISAGESKNRIGGRRRKKKRTKKKTRRKRRKKRKRRKRTRRKRRKRKTRVKK